MHRSHYMIVVSITGGIGNQMFQYAFSKALADQLGIPLFLDTHFFTYVKDRQYLLDFLGVNDPILSEKEAKQFKRQDKRLFRRLGLSLGLMRPIYLNEGAAEHTFQEAFTKLKAPLYLEGYWQTHGYIEWAEAVVSRYFRTLQPKAEQVALCEEMAACNAVSLHIRRGDYVSNATFAKVHGSLPLEYYKNAVADCRRVVESPHLYVFSDDPTWAREHLDFNLPMTIVDVNGPDAGHYDLALMMRCKHNIIANSSFSWWGAYLNENPLKSVWYPGRWYAGMPQPKDLCPPTWSSVNCS